MAVQFNEDKKIFRLDTETSTYLMGLTPEGYLGHIYYGDRLYKETENYMLRMEEPPYTPSVNKREKSSFLDSFPMEYPTGGIGDYRDSCLNVVRWDARSTMFPTKSTMAKKHSKDFRHLSAQRKKCRLWISSVKMRFWGCR